MSTSFIVSLAASLLVGGTIGGVAVYQTTASVQVTCPAQPVSSNPPDFFHASHLPTTGGKGY